jgi:hypothetical protein
VLRQVLRSVGRLLKTLGSKTENARSPSQVALADAFVRRLWLQSYSSSSFRFTVFYRLYDIRAINLVHQKQLFR